MEQPNPTAIPQAPVKKPGTIELLKQSYAVLKSDKELVLFPVYSAVYSILGFIAVGAIYAAVRWGLMNGQQNSAVDYIFLFILYLVSYYIAIYFNAGLAACALYRFKGGDPTLKYGLTEAKKHRRSILKYAILGAIVGVILQFIAERFKLAGRIVANILGAAWSIATIFIAPVLVTSDLPPLEAVKESARIFRQTWGNTVKGSISFGLIGILGAIVCFVPFILAISIGGSAIIFAGVIISVLAVLLWAIILSTCSNIYRTALFHYATTRQVPAGFTPGLSVAVR